MRSSQAQTGVPASARGYFWDWTSLPTDETWSLSPLSSSLALILGFCSVILLGDFWDPLIGRFTKEKKPPNAKSRICSTPRLASRKEECPRPVRKAWHQEYRNQKQMNALSSESSMEPCIRLIHSKNKIESNHPFLSVTVQNRLVWRAHLRR